MILSRTMRPADYRELAPELEELNKTIAVVGPVPYTHRRWEYALTLRAAEAWFENKKFLEVADFGCETGLSPSLMLMQGHNVTLYEIWAWGNKQAEAEDKAKRAASKSPGVMYRFVNRPLGGLLEQDKSRYDIALCISVIEHIPEEQEAFRDLMLSVKPGGMLLVTMDFAPVEKDTLFYHWLRARIYNEAKMKSLVDRAQAYGFQLIDGKADWSWSKEMVMVQNEYGFSSLVLVRS